jgi:hypothetical protein
LSLLSSSVVVVAVAITNAVVTAIPSAASFSLLLSIHHLCRHHCPRRRHCRCHFAIAVSAAIFSSAAFGWLLSVTPAIAIRRCLRRRSCHRRHCYHCHRCCRRYCPPLLPPTLLQLPIAAIAAMDSFCGTVLILIPQ